MAVAYDASASAKFSNVNGTQTLSHTCTGSNRYLVFQIARYDGTLATLSSITYNGVTMTSIGNTTSGAVRIDSYGLIAPATGANNCSVTLSDADQGVCLSAVSFTGVHQTTPTGTLRTNTGTTSTVAWQGVDAASGDFSLGAIVWDQGAAARTLSERSGIPAWIATGTMTASTAVTSITGSNAPAGQMLGDIEIAAVRTETGAPKTFTWSGTGWTKIGSDRAQGANSSMGWAYRIYDGTNVNPGVSWTGSSDASIVRHLLRDSRVSGTVVAQHGTVGTGTASPATSTGANTTAADVLALLSTGSGVNNAFGASTNWTEVYDAGSATGPARQALDTREFATSGSATGNTSKTNTSPVSWISQQFQLYQAANGDQTNRQTQGDIGNIASFRVSTETADVYNTFGWTMSVAGANWATHGFAIKQSTGTNFTQSVAGSITGAGALTRKTLKKVAGSSTGTGVVRKLTRQHTLTGSLTGVGVSNKFTRQDTFTGSITLSGALSSMVIIQTTVTGSLTMTGALTRKIAKRVLGTITLTGALRRFITRRLAGSLTATGALFRKTTKAFAGSITASGVDTERTRVGQAKAGSITASGTASGTLIPNPGTPSDSPSISTFLRRFVGRR